MKINEYKIGNLVQILVNNPRNNDQYEWRDAEVLYKRMIHPNVGEKHKPYPILIVKLIRTYCKAKAIYKWIDGNIPVYVGSNLEFYDKENEEGIIYSYLIRLKS